MTPSRDQLLIVTPHSSGQLPADVLRDMLGDDAFDSAKRRAWLRHIFLDGDPFTDLMYAVPGARLVSAAWSRFAVDVNRDRSDTVDNGVVKLMDFDRQPLYPAGFVLSDAARETRLKRIWDTFDALVRAELVGAKLMIAGHSMAPSGPKLGPDTGVARPGICLMLGTDAVPTFPRAQWEALQAACERAFAPVLQAAPHPEVKIGVPWDTDFLSLHHMQGSGVPAFGIEFNAALYMHDGEALDDAVRALSLAFEQFADAALALV